MATTALDELIDEELAQIGYEIEQRATRPAASEASRAHSPEEKEYNQRKKDGFRSEVSKCPSSYQTIRNYNSISYNYLKDVPHVRWSGKRERRASGGQVLGPAAPRRRQRQALRRHRSRAEGGQGH